MAGALQGFRTLCQTGDPRSGLRLADIDRASALEVRLKLLWG